MYGRILDHDHFGVFLAGVIDKEVNSLVVYNPVKSWHLLFV